MTLKAGYRHGSKLKFRRERTFACQVPGISQFPGGGFHALPAGGVSAGAELSRPLPDHVQERLLVLME